MDGHKCEPARGGRSLVRLKKMAIYDRRRTEGILKEERNPLYGK
jgi:hypothetical protein